MQLRETSSFDAGVSETCNAGISGIGYKIFFSIDVGELETLLCETSPVIAGTLEISS